MELLAPAIVTVLTLFAKWSFKKWGAEVGKITILFTAFLISFIAAVIVTQVDEQVWQKLLEVFAIQMAYYQVIFKMVVVPVLAKFKQ